MAFFSRHLIHNRRSKFHFSFFKTPDTFSKCLDTIHMSQISFVHWTKITGSKYHNFTWLLSWLLRLGPRTMFSGGPDHPPLNVILRGAHNKISAMGPKFLATALRAITVSGPSTVYHLVSTPYSPFLTVTWLKSLSPHGGGRFSTGSSQTSPSFPGHRWCLQCPMSGLYLPYQKMFSKIFS